MGYRAETSPDDDYSNATDLTINGIPIQISCDNKSKREKDKLRKRGILSVVAGENIDEDTLRQTLEEATSEYNRRRSMGAVMHEIYNYDENRTRGRNRRGDAVEQAFPHMSLLNRFANLSSAQADPANNGDYWVVPVHQNGTSHSYLFEIHTLEQQDEDSQTLDVVGDVVLLPEMRKRINNA
jgi:hypothetical protein